MRTVVISLLLTWAFFIEYLPPAQRIHLWSDIDGYHYPLLDYANKAVWKGRFPLWDSAIYCGIPFAGNPQAALFYPPNWLLFLVNARMPADLRGPSPAAAHGIGMQFTTIEALAFLHAWLAFLFTWYWLRQRTSGWVPASLGAMVVACSGYMMSQMNHLGVICGFAWIPFALWGLDQANEQRRWRPLWKVAVAGAMCLLAGYPPTLIGLAFICLTYAVALQWRKTLVPLTVAALAFSGMLGAVQLLPAMEATRLKLSEAAFGSGLPFGNGLYGSMLLPNWFDQNRTNAGPEAGDGDYMYLGVPFLFGLLYVIRRGRIRGAGIAIILVCACLFVAADPTGIILRTLEHIPFLLDVIRRYNFMPGLVIGAALLAAVSIDDFLLRRVSWTPPKAVWLLWAAVTILWCGYLLVTNRFATGWRSAMYPAATLGLLAFGLHTLRSGLSRTAWTSVLIVFCVFAEYHAFGTDRRFNAVDGLVEDAWRGDGRVGGATLNGLDDEVYREMLQHPEFRVGIHEGPQPPDFRYYRLTTPHGDDPLITNQYRAVVKRFAPFTTNRRFDINPLDERMLQQFGVRWVFVRNGSTMHSALETDKRFRKLLPGTSFFVVFEYLAAVPPWRFRNGVSTLKNWTPEHRSFEVTSASGGEFVLIEQLFPGWRAQIDDNAIAITRADGAFQAVQVPAGKHVVEFRYLPLSFVAGALISVSGSLLLGFAVQRSAA